MTENNKIFVPRVRVNDTHYSMIGATGNLIDDVDEKSSISIYSGFQVF